MSDVGTILTYRTVKQLGAYEDAIRSDISDSDFGNSVRDLGVTRLTFWVQRNPDAALVRWEGRDIESVLERYATSRDPVLAKWRGLLRVFSGPEEAESYWEASRHRIFSWATDEESDDSEIRVFSSTKEIEALSRLYEDIQNDPAHLGVFDRIRKGQGFTRVEAWTQRMGEETLLLNLFEARDLDRAYSLVEAETNDFDRRIMKTRRAALKGPPLRAKPAAKLVADWHA